MSIGASVKLGFLGDIALCRSVEDYYNKFQQIADPKIYDCLKHFDKLIVNLECPIASKGTKNPFKHSVLKAGASMARALVDLGVDVCTLANNHILDYGNEAAKETMELLTNQGIAFLGIGSNFEEAKRPLVMTVNGCSIGLLNYCSYREYWASQKTFGCSPEDFSLVDKDVRSLKRNVDFVIVALHTGIEFSAVPEASLIKACRGFIDSGASIVIGHHPHWIQGAEKYKNGVIAYSLGNFIFDPFYMVNPDRAALESAIFSVDLNKEQVSFRWEPVLLNSTGIPFLIDSDEEKRLFLHKIDTLSQQVQNWENLTHLQDLELTRNFKLQLKVAWKDFRSKGFPYVLHLFKTRRIRKKHIKALLNLILKRKGKVQIGNYGKVPLGE